MKKTKNVGCCCCCWRWAVAASCSGASVPRSVNRPYRVARLAAVRCCSWSRIDASFCVSVPPSFQAKQDTRFHDKPPGNRVKPVVVRWRRSSFIYLFSPLPTKPISHLTFRRFPIPERLYVARTSVVAICPPPNIMCLHSQGGACAERFHCILSNTSFKQIVFYLATSPDDISKISKSCDFTRPTWWLCMYI